MKERLDLYPVNNSILNDAIDRIVVKLHGLNKKNGAKTFLCTGAGANGGTTTVALNIAISLAEAGWKTVFLDCDLRKDQRFKRIGTEAKTSLTGFLTGEVPDHNNIIYNTSVDNLDYIFSGEKNENPVRLLCNAKMETLLSRLKKSYDFVIIDTPPVSITNDAEILIPVVDKYLIVVCMNETTKKQLVDSRIQLGDYEKKFAGIVANKLGIMQYKGAVKDFDYFSKKNLLKKQNDAIERKKGK